MSRDAAEMFFYEPPVVLWVSRMPQPLADAPAAVTVIDADLIRASGARDLADLLRLVPGFQVAYGDAGSPIVVYHGMSDLEPKRLQVLVDGRSQYSPLFVGAVNWNMIDVRLADIERIEVVRGTNSAAYGSNAFLGIVNVVTRHSAESRGAEVSVARGNQGVEDRSVRVGAALGPGSFRLAAEQFGDDGLERIFDSRTTRRVQLRVDMPVSARDAIEFSAGRTGVTLGDAAGGFVPDRRTDRSSTHLQGTWRRQLDDRAETLVRLAHVEERSDDRLLLDRTADLGLSALFDYSLTAMRDEVEGQYLWVDGPLRLVAGGGARSDSTRSRQLYGTDQAMRQTVVRAFAHGEWRLTPVALINFGGTWERDSISGGRFSPRLMLNWRIAPGQVLRAGGSRGYRMPTIYEARAREEYFDIATGALIDANTRTTAPLAPERIDSFELGYLLDLPKWRTGLDLRLFDEHVDRAIVWFPRALPGGVPGSADCELFGPFDGNFAFRPCGSARDFANTARLHIRGVEYQARWQPLRSTRLSFNQAFIHIDAHVFGDDVPDGSTGGGDYLHGITRHLTRSAPQRADSLIVQQDFGARWSLFAVWSRVGTQKSSLSSEAPAYERLDWRLAYRFGGPKLRGELALTVQSEGQRHAERFGNRADAEQNDWLYPRRWLSLRLSL